MSKHEMKVLQEKELSAISGGSRSIEAQVIALDKTLLTGNRQVYFNRFRRLIDNMESGRPYADIVSDPRGSGDPEGDPARNRYWM